MRLINIDDAMSIYDDFTKGDMEENDRYNLYVMLEEKAIEDKPHGEWINDADAEKSICSICNHEYRWIKYDRPYEFAYCPSCGEKMFKPQERSDKE